MIDIVKSKFEEWTERKTPREARIAIFNRIRDIPYAVIPEINDAKNYTRILLLNRGSCTPKHFLLCSMFQKLGLQVLYVIYRYNWSEFEEIFPPALRKLARKMPQCYHLACKVDIDGRLVLVDATLDPALARVGLPVNQAWDGASETILPISPTSDEEVYDPTEAKFVQERQMNNVSRTFYNGLNAWMELLRGKNSERI
jgi:hypothetical protein